MNDEKKVLAERIDALRSKSYTELDLIVKSPPDVEEIAIGNQDYQIDTRCFYEGKNASIRVTVSLFKPKKYEPWWKFWKNVDSSALSESFVVSRD